MRFKSVSFLFVVMLMLALVSGGVMAAPLTHDISDGDVIINTCGDNCPGHVITGEVITSFNTIQILSGDHKITLKDLYVHCGYPNPMTDERINDGAALYIADGVQNVELTIKGDVYLHNVYALYSAAEKLTILGDETSVLDFGGQYEGGYAKNIEVKGGCIDFSSASIFPAKDGDRDNYKSHLRGLVVDETASFDNAKIRAIAYGFGEPNQLYSGGAADAVVSAGIQAKKLELKNCELYAESGNIDYVDGEIPNSIAIDVETLDVADSTISAIGGDAYKSIGIRCVDSANFVNSDVTAAGGAAESTSVGFDAFHANAVGALKSYFEWKGGTSGSISVGGDINIMDAVDSTIDAYGGEAKRHSAGLIGGTLSVEGSFVNGYGGVATDTDVVEYPDGTKGGVFSEGIDIATIKGTDSEIYGLGEKAMISAGIWSTEISINGGVIEGRGDDEAEYSFGICLEPSRTDDWTPIPVKFDIVGGNVIANGSTMGLMVDDDDFAGVSYKADKNAEAQLKNDFTNETFVFGNKYKVTYSYGDIVAKNMPANAEYYLGEDFLLSKEIPTADDYQFLGWREMGSGFFYSVATDHYFGMTEEGYHFVAEWKCLGGKDCVLHDFKDLDPEEWYHDGIEYCYDLEVMLGMSKDTFEPYTETSRAMVVTTLYRFAAEPETEGKAKFSDVEEGKWYTDAVKWASESGIVAGYPDGTFRPDRIATREELAVFLYRFADYMELNLEREPLPDTFTDKGDVSTWALPAMEWAVTTADIINGVDETTLSPKTHANRAQMATMIQRLNEYFLSEFAY